MNKQQTLFTPGPWKFTLATSTIKGWEGIRYIVITANDELKTVESCDRPELEKLANGTLMAAAPEMFSTLVEVYDTLIKSEPGNQKILVRECLTKIDEVIKKATTITE